jgi:hypothetical protein
MFVGTLLSTFLSNQITCYVMMTNVKTGELLLFSTWVNTGCQIMEVLWSFLIQMVSFSSATAIYWSTRHPFMLHFSNVQTNSMWTHHSYIPAAVSHTHYNIFQVLNFYYSLPNIIQVVKSSTVIQAGHAARMAERRGACRFFWRETWSKSTARNT